MFKLMKAVVEFFDKLEDHVRGSLSHFPIFYAIVGGIGVVLFWRGVWHFADEINLSSLGSIVIGTVVLLMTGLFTSMFIGDHIILSGLKHEKKVTDLTEKEVETERDMLKHIKKEIDDIEKDVDNIETKLK